jgi:hypothetical protein
VPEVRARLPGGGRWKLGLIAGGARLVRHADMRSSGLGASVRARSSPLPDDTLEHLTDEQLIADVRGAGWRSAALSRQGMVR